MYCGALILVHTSSSREEYYPICFFSISGHHSSKSNSSPSSSRACVRPDATVYSERICSPVVFWITPEQGSFKKHVRWKTQACLPDVDNLSSNVAVSNASLFPNSSNPIILNVISIQFQGKYRRTRDRLTDLLLRHRRSISHRVIL
jgi:hypothetical protein